MTPDPFFHIRLAELNATALLHVVAGVHRELGDDVPFDHRLTTESRIRGQVPRRVEPVEFVVLLFAQVLLALADDQMTRGAGAASATRVLEWNAEIHRHVEKRLGQSVM